MGSLPPGCDYIRRLCNSMRVELESAVAALRGEVSLADAATIQTATRFERHAQLAQRWLKLNPELPVDVKLSISRDIAKASEARDRCIRALGLHERPDPWASLHLPDFGDDPGDASPDAAGTPAGSEPDPNQGVQGPEASAGHTSDHSAATSNENDREWVTSDDNLGGQS
jgi:hypothetical protein